jgi:hypothetical protein
LLKKCKDRFSREQTHRKKQDKASSIVDKNFVPCIDDPFNFHFPWVLQQLLFDAALT